MSHTHGVLVLEHFAFRAVPVKAESLEPLYLFFTHVVAQNWFPFLDGKLQSAIIAPFCAERQATKNLAEARFFVSSSMSVLDTEIAETVFELRYATAAIEQGLRTTGPSWVRGRIDIEVHRIAFLAPGRAGHVFSAIGHHDLDGVVVGMDAGFHLLNPESLG